MEELSRARNITDIIYAEHCIRGFEGDSDRMECSMSTLLTGPLDAIAQAATCVAQCQGRMQALEGLHDECQFSRLRNTLNNAKQLEEACKTLTGLIEIDLEASQVI